MHTALRFLICLVFISSATFAQRWDWDNNWDNWWDDVFDRYDTPMIELNGGVTQFDHKNFTGDFSELGIIEFKLGYSSKKHYDHFLVDLSEKFFQIAKINRNVHYDEASLDRTVSAKLWRAGFGYRNGIGYQAGNFAFIPYIQQSFNIIKFDSFEYPYNSGLDLSASILNENIRILNKYNDDYKFAYQLESGLKFELGNLISLNGAYEVNTVFPSIKTWKLLGSFAIQYAAEGILDEFIEEIEYSTPEAAPIVNFVLKSALNYSIYTLRKDKNSWPFETETPLVFDSYKVGLTFTF